VTVPFPRAAPGPAFRFAVTGADHDVAALTPTLRLHLAISETTGTRVHALALRTQIRIEPARRRYGPVEQGRLVELFGEPERWGRTLHPMQLATVASVAPGFTGQGEIVLEVPLSSDAEIATTRYLRGLADGEVPLLLLFSGTVFYEGEHGVQVALVPWSSETSFRLPLAVWERMVEHHYGGTTWLPLPARTFDQLAAWRARHAQPSWERTVAALLEAAEGREP
jgi:hypothetical protein